MPKFALVAMLLLLPASGWAQTGCEISNTGADSGIATISGTQNMGYSAPGGIGAVGFRIPVACVTGSVSYHVLQVDANPLNTYDIGLYCVSGDCAAGGYGGHLYVHTGAMYGTWFTNHRQAATLMAVPVQGSGTPPYTVTLTGTFAPYDFPLQGEFSISCQDGLYNGGEYQVASVFMGPPPGITASTQSHSKTADTCTVTSDTVFPLAFPSSNVCTNGTASPQCQEALPWVSDNQTVCKSLPCTLPAGLYAAAIGTNCTDTQQQGQASICAYLMGDADEGLIYAFTASASNYSSTTGLPATMSFTVNSTTAVWNTTQGPSAPIKPVKLLIY